MGRTHTARGRKSLRVAIGREMQFQRLERNLRQADIAECVGCHINTISNVERGLNPTTVDLWLSVAHCLDIPPLDLIPDTFKVSEW